jgi:hypothetical protein
LINRRGWQENPAPKNCRFGRFCRIICRDGHELQRW